jgi:hypothetical protein
MSTHTRTIAVHNPIQWFMTGVATTLVAVALAAGLALAILVPATEPGQLTSAPAAGSFLDEGFRLQRAGEIGAGRASASAPWLSGLTDHRKGEIGSAGASVSDFGGLDLTEHRRGEINAGR